jgi:hypothetical protein
MVNAHMEDQSNDVQEWKRSYSVPLEDSHPSCAHPGAIEPHDDLHMTLDVVRKAYDWCVGDDGRLYGLVAGDMGWCATSIVLDPANISASLRKQEATE